MKAKNIPWLQEPSSSIIDSLVACGLVSSKAHITQKPKPQPNLKTTPPNLKTPKTTILTSDQLPKGPASTKPKLPQSSASPFYNNRTLSQIRAATPSYDKKRSSSQLRSKTAKEGRKIVPTNISRTTGIDGFTTPAITIEDNFLSPTKNDSNSDFSSQSESFMKSPDISEYIGNNRKYAGRKDAQELASNYHLFLKTINLDDYSDPQSISEGIQKSLDYTILTFNKLILQLRGYSEEHAKLLVEIKNFFIQRIEQLPEMSRIYTQKLEEADKRVESMNEIEKGLKDEITDREMTIKSLQNEIDQGQNRYEKLNFLLQQTQEKYNQTILSNAQFEDDKKSLMFKLSKSEEALNQAQQTATANQEMLNNARAQLKSQETLIEKYQQEGAGFRPLYLKATDENSKLKDQIVELQEKIQGMVVRQETSDIEIQTDPVIVTPINQLNQNGKRKKDRVRSCSFKRASLNPAEDMNFLPMNNTKKSSDQILQNQSSNLSQDSKRKLPMIPATNSKLKNDIDLKSNNNSTPPQNSPTSNDQPNVNNNNSISSTPENQNDTDSKNNNKENNKDTNIPIQSTSTNLSINKSSAKLLSAQSSSIQIKNFPSLAKLNSVDSLKVVNKVTGSNSSVPLPSDYRIDNKHVETPPTLVNCIYRLLPLRLDLTLSNSPSVRINTIIAKGKSQPKEFYWVLHRIVDFFHAMYSIDNVTSTEEDTVTLFRNNLLESCEMEVLADKIFSDIVQSCQFYKLTNSCVRFFLQFLLQDLTIVDFKFFNIIFNLCFEYIYPPIAEIIDDQDVLPEQPLFLIHVDICQIVLDLVFPYHSTNFDYSALRKETKTTVHVDLIDFFAFATRMIGLFRETHHQFHNQVKNMLTLVGWSQTVEMSEPLFKDFFVLVEPTSEKQDIDKLWKRFTLEMSMNEEDVTINQASFIHFCSDFPDLSNKLLSLPYISNFDHAFSQLPSPLQELLTFIKKRFTKFVREIYLMLPKELKNISEKIILKVRNSLLRCDISTSLISYRHFLQLIDLKLTELNPFMVFSQNTSVNDVNMILSMLHSRESLAVISLGSGVKIEHELTTITDKPRVILDNNNGGLESLIPNEEEDDEDDNNNNEKKESKNPKEA
ncbi:hypothetical protein M9Y10_024259 [Tritrichomonas musculus]|uniref:Translin-associated factor X-interacting protein 1 N-terminal domain-containing protein n=1 Tax=Tritrichomonas musculus TaxID=1915356 RepID=A0ABR2HDG7_9EUKA